MKFQADRDVWLTAVELVAPVGDTPIGTGAYAGHVLIVAEGNSVSLRTRDDALIASTRFDAVCSKAGSACVPLSHLRTLLKNVTPGTIRATTLDNRLVLRASSAGVALGGLSPDNYPQPPLPSQPSVALPLALVSQVLQSVLFASSKESHKIDTWGVSLYSKGSSVIARATDAQVVAQATVATTKVAAGEWFWSRPVASKVAKLSGVEATFLNVGESANHFFISTDALALSATKLTRSFANVEPLIPRENLPSALVHRDQLLQAVELAGAVDPAASAYHPTVELRFERDGIVFYVSEGATGKASFVLKTQWNGSSLRRRVSIDALRRAARHAIADGIEVLASDTWPFVALRSECAEQALVVSVVTFQ